MGMSGSRCFRIGGTPASGEEEGERFSPPLPKQCKRSAKKGGWAQGMLEQGFTQRAGRIVGYASRRARDSGTPGGVPHSRIPYGNLERDLLEPRPARRFIRDAQAPRLRQELQ